MKNKIIAVDFDGTLCENKYPDIGSPNISVIRKLIKERENGARVILWTCRRGEELARAVYWCANHGIYLDAINENLQSMVEKFGGDTRKIYADEYWDDRAVYPFFGDVEEENRQLKCRLAAFKKILNDVAGVNVIE